MKTHWLTLYAFARVRPAPVRAPGSACPDKTGEYPVMPTASQSRGRLPTAFLLRNRQRYCSGHGNLARIKRVRLMRTAVQWTASLAMLIAAAAQAGPYYQRPAGVAEADEPLIVAGYRALFTCSAYFFAGRPRR